MTTPWRLKEKLKLHTILQITTLQKGKRRLRYWKKSTIRCQVWSCNNLS